MLSKEHIKKGCELVDEYVLVEFPKYSVLSNRYYEFPFYNDGTPTRSHPEGSKWMQGHASIYRDFLQLVIEGINKEYRQNKEIGYCIDQMSDCIEVCIDMSDSCGCYFYTDYTETEAKETAIAYVFDNMEVE